MEAVSMQETYSSTLRTKHFWYCQKQDVGRIGCNILDMCLGIFTFIWRSRKQRSWDCLQNTCVWGSSFDTGWESHAMALTNQPCLTYLRLLKSHTCSLTRQSIPPWAVTTGMLIRIRELSSMSHISDQSSTCTWGFYCSSRSEIIQRSLLEVTMRDFSTSISDNDSMLNK